MTFSEIFFRYWWVSVVAWALYAIYYTNVELPLLERRPKVEQAQTVSRRATITKQIFRILLIFMAACLICRFM